MIFSSIRKRLSVKFRLLNNQGESSSNNEIKDNFFVIPYINHIAEKFIQYFKNTTNFKLAFGINRLNKFIKVQKDSLPIFSHSNVIYRINCAHCEALYVSKHIVY